ncbi:sterol desaturase family protein [Lacibacter sediminis]|uniref:Sterol desaturase family protein n=1 Tax=Lacibacter sediminis TaxID=2760713 RepID=A0A7G5XET6_9BACT|nr:sterol desaturase family protein [Lacibacter sediminis]QNA43989.1 sterol desaturase family protein [Lacibacter sediminis]
MKFSSKTAIPWKEIIANLQSGHILLWVIRGLSLFAYDYALQNYSFGIINQLPVAVQWIIGFIAWDFCFYWSHRFHHSVKFLWAVHGVHHEGEHFNLSLGIRNSWYSSITSYPFYAVMAFAGIPLDIFITVSGIHFFIQFYNHNHFVKKSGWLEYILITPSHHRVHHGKNDLYVDKNFGGTFVVWDKLFRTFQAEKRDIPVIFGVNDAINSSNPVITNNHRFFTGGRLLKKMKQSVSSTTSLPISISASASFLLFIFLLFFIWQETSFEGYQKPMLFLLIFLGTIANGVILEGRKWGVLLWCIISLPLNFIVILFFKQPFWLYLIISVLLAAHGLFSIYSYSRQIKKAAGSSELKQLI